jgi:hypothetical protein
MRDVEPWFPFILLLNGACSTGLPSALPPTSAASESETTASLPDLGVALREDPPLPGVNADRWPGLGTAVPMEHHHHDRQATTSPDAGTPVPSTPGM